MHDCNRSSCRHKVEIVTRGVTFLGKQGVIVVTANQPTVGSLFTERS